MSNHEFVGYGNTRPSATRTRTLGIDLNNHDSIDSISPAHPRNQSAHRHAIPAADRSIGDAFGFEARLPAAFEEREPSTRRRSSVSPPAPKLQRGHLCSSTSNPGPGGVSARQPTRPHSIDDPHRCERIQTILGPMRWPNLVFTPDISTHRGPASTRRQAYECACFLPRCPVPERPRARERMAEHGRQPRLLHQLWCLILLGAGLVGAFQLAPPTRIASGRAGVRGTCMRCIGWDDDCEQAGNCDGG